MPYFAGPSHALHHNSSLAVSSVFCTGFPTHVMLENNSCTCLYMIHTKPYIFFTPFTSAFNGWTKRRRNQSPLCLGFQPGLTHMRSLAFPSCTSPIRCYLPVTITPLLHAIYLTGHHTHTHTHNIQVCQTVIIIYSFIMQISSYIPYLSLFIILSGWDLPQINIHLYT
jgi:hypothetical protein